MAGGPGLEQPPRVIDLPGPTCQQTAPQLNALVTGGTVITCTMPFSLRTDQLPDAAVLIGGRVVPRTMQLSMESAQPPDAAMLIGSNAVPRTTQGRLRSVQQSNAAKLIDGNVVPFTGPLSSRTTQPPNAAMLIDSNIVTRTMSYSNLSSKAALSAASLPAPEEPCSSANAGCNSTKNPAGPEKSRSKRLQELFSLQTQRSGSCTKHRAPLQNSSYVGGFRLPAEAEICASHYLAG